MRFGKGLAAAVAGLTVAAVAGCAAAAAGPGPSPRAPAAPQASGHAASSGKGASSAALAPSITPRAEAAIRPAAAHFYAVLLGREFATSWELLAPAVRKQIPLRVWTGVHEACPTADAGKPRIIKTVTVFGDAAIVTSAVTGAPAKAGLSEDVFNYADGRWWYSPEDLGIYEHGSVAADVAAAKSAGLCAGWKSF